MTDETVTIGDTVDVTITRAKQNDDETFDDPDITEVSDGDDADPSTPKNDPVPEE